MLSVGTLYSPLPTESHSLMWLGTQAKKVTQVSFIRKKSHITVGTNKQTKPKHNKQMQNKKTKTNKQKTPSKGIIYTSHLCEEC